jgi:FtsP/CotA-like multicopper oxidase with cupredoxin domain
MSGARDLYARGANMTDRRSNSTSRRSFLNGLMTTTALVASGSALAQTHHGSHGGPRLRATGPAAAAPVAGPGGFFVNPPPIVGVNGNYALNVTMRAAFFNGQPVSVQSYVDPNNASQIVQPLVGPTITITNNGLPPRGQPSQLVSVRLNNVLPREQSPAPPGPVTSGMDDNPHGFQTTNLHVHGLHVAPLEDNVYLELQPAANGRTPVCAPSTANPVWVCNGTYTYRYNFGRTPTGTTRIPAGTYWYHPHKHGSVGSQVASGMAGAFIVKGDLDTIPGVAGLAEKVMVAQLIPYASYSRAPGSRAVVDPYVYYGIPLPNGKQPPTPLPPGANTQISINGQVNPTLTMQYGEIQRWRFVNATADQFFSLAVVPLGGATAPMPELYVIAVDGVPLTNSTSGIPVPFKLEHSTQGLTAFTAAVRSEIGTLAPAQRLDLLVRLPPAPTAPSTPVAYAIQAVPFNATNVGPATTQNILTVVGVYNAAKNANPDRLPDPARFNAGALYRPPLTGAIPASPTQNIQFGFLSSQVNQGNTGAIVNNTNSQTPFGVSPPTPPATTPPGSPPPPPPVGASPFALPMPAQLQLKLNAVDKWNVVSANAGPHAFHIHINSFLMTQRNGIDISSARIWRDTARIDQAAAGPSPSVQFVSQQVDYTGAFVMHCHFLEHEDSGMMWSVNIS